MRKLLLSTVTLLLIGFAANAQPGIRLGIKAGANFNELNSNTFNSGFDFAYHIGGFAEIDLNRKIGIQPEVLWSQSSYTRGSNINAIYQTLPSDVKLDYLAIPVLLRYSVTNMFTFTVGPQFGILMNSNENLLQNGTAAFTKGDLALVLGGQINLKMLRIYGRYNAGLQDINDAPNQEKWTSKQIQLGIGLRL
ncbi:MAG: porin family protein [Sediminibacterium sp.]|nr:MAG: hypothetical protein FD183_1496 [Chitinophagaceae bacterium]MDP1844232.1 porin family protein [Sediminibacterium sp.]